MMNNTWTAVVPVIPWLQYYYNTNIPQSRCSSRRRRRRRYLYIIIIVGYYVWPGRHLLSSKPGGTLVFTRPTNTRSRRAFVVVIGCTFFSSLPLLYLPHTSPILLLYIYNMRTHVYHHSTRTKSVRRRRRYYYNIINFVPGRLFFCHYFFYYYFFFLEAFIISSSQSSDRPAGHRRRVESENNRALYLYLLPLPLNTHTHTTRTPGPRHRRPRGSLLYTCAQYSARSPLRLEEAVACVIYIYMTGTYIRLVNIIIIILWFLNNNNDVICT